MNVGELKKALEDIPDEVLVGNSGHFGEYLEVYSTNRRMCSESWRSSKDTVDVFILDIEEAGPEPD